MKEKKILQKIQNKYINFNAFNFKYHLNVI